MCSRCASGQRATRAAERLQKELGGAVKLSVLDGGVKGLGCCGIAAHSRQGVISLERQVRIAAGSFVLTGWCWASSSPGVVCASGFVGGRIGLCGYHGYLWDGNAARPHAVE